MKKIIFLFISIFVSLFVLGQTNYSLPKGWDLLKEDELNAVFQLQELDIESLIEEDRENKSLLKPWRFGVKKEVDLGFQDGQWTELINGDKFWRLKINSPNALSLNLIFDQFFLPTGSELFFYDESRNELLGKYTSLENNESHRFGTWLIESNNLIIEYYEPSTVTEEVEMHLESITQGYRNAKSFKNEKTLNSSGDCNLDVDCSIGGDWNYIKELNKKSVGILISGGNSFCSGALVNNTADDGKPYFLTANHCYSNPANWSFKFDWVSPDPVCATSAISSDSATTKILSGATLRARSSNTDFCLVEINSAIPTAWNLTWAGWDRSDEIPDYVVGIHHPRGDVMKVSRDDTRPIKSSNSGAETWEITAAGGGWEMGVTEGGSSGSPLFDQNGKIIGQLYGGGADCNGTSDNGSNDFYGRFGVSWDGASSSVRLKDWLDPNNLNVNTIESFPPLQVFSLDAQTAIYFPEAVCGEETVSPIVKLTNRGSTILTSATITWSLNAGTPTTINWIGSLARYESEEVSLGALTSSNGVFNIGAKVSLPNNGVDDFQENDSSSNSLTLSQNGFQTTKVHLDLFTDDYASETSWEFRKVDGTVISSGGPYNLNNANFSESFDVLLDECYQFEIFDSSGDGICCLFGSGTYKLTTDNNTIIKEGGSFNSSDLTEMSITGLLGVNPKDEKTGINLFPNPVTDELKVELTSSSLLQYKVYSSVGQITIEGVIATSGIINVASLSRGVYFLEFIDDQEVIGIKKIIKK